MATDVTYTPLDILKPIAENLWIVDSGPQHVAGLSLPVRMTVVRLGNGDMWLHSPTRYTDSLKQEIEALGPVRHLVAPSPGHWTHLKEWQARCPEARTSAAPNLRHRSNVQKAGIRIDRDLAERPPEEWSGEIEQVIVPGGGGFREVAFFHSPTRTLVLTDLVQNLEPEKLPPVTRLFARLSGSTGRPPAYLRLVLRVRRGEARDAVARLIAWNPERVVFSHGRWFERDGTARLQRAFDWLLG